MANHTDSITTTRLTRMIYVEETERRNSTYKSFESETNVEEIVKSTSSVAGSNKKSPGTTPKATAKSKSMPVPSLDITKTLAEMTSPLKTMKVPKNAVAPAEIIPIKDNVVNTGKDEGLIKAIEHDLTEKANNAKNAQNAQNEEPEIQKPVDDEATADEQNKEGTKGEISASEADVETPVLYPNGEVPETPPKGEPSKPTPPTNGDAPQLANGDVVTKEEGTKEQAADAEKQPAELTMQNETLVQNVNTPSTLPNNVEQQPPVPDTTPNVPTGIQSTDIEKGAVEAEVKESVAPLPEMKVFSKHNSSGSLSSGSSAPPMRQDDPNQPPSRRSTRRNLLHHMKSKGKFSQLEEAKSISESLLYGTLKPLLFLMKCTGIFFIPKKGQFGKTWREFFRSCTPLQIYCIVMSFILFVNFFRSLFAFNTTDGFSNTLFLKFLTAIFMYESSSRAVLAYWHSYRKAKGLTTFFLTVEQICYSDKIIPYEQELKRVMQASIVISIAISLSNMGSNAYGMLGTASDQFSSYLVPVAPDAPGVLAMKIFVLILLLINGLVAMLSLSFFTTVCYVLYKEFEYLCRTFVMKIKEDGSFTDDLEKFRITHQKRCKLVEDADSMFKYYIANTYMTNVPLLCMLLYIIVYAEGSDLSYRLINAFRLFYVLVQMVVVSWAATMINNQAHAPLGDIYSIKVVSCTSERQLEVNMFLNKLTGTQIGMTAWDMFVINKPTVLTVVGMVLTYFFLLVQFKNPLGEPTQCRCFVNVSSDELRSLVSETTTEVWDMMTSNTTIF